MAERKSLVEGLKSQPAVDPNLEKSFVYQQPAEEAAPAAPAAIETGRGASTVVGRVPLTIRFRAELASALKRASLERQLSGTSPNKLQDILDEAVEPWLRSKGYLK